MPATTIHIRGITKTFPNPSGGVATAVDNVSLTIQAGELFFLLGPSGCGKTTLLRMIAGFIDPSAGQIVFDQDGKSSDVTYLAPNLRNTGMVFQSYALWPHMTVFDNVAFGLTIRKLSKQDTKSRVMEALEAVQMGHLAARKPNQLSGGQQQRVALARALVIRPAVLLLDEPLSNLDAKLRNDLRAEIRRICKNAGLTAIYVTHDQKEALSMADRIAIMQSGKIVQLGAPTEMYRRPNSRFVAEFLGETNILEAKVSGNVGDALTLDTPAGKVVSRFFVPPVEGEDSTREGGGGKAQPSPALAPIPATNSTVLLSLRPEALRLSPTWAPAGENALPAKVLETTFLGEVAQHVVELKGGQRLKLAQLNPAGGAGRSVHQSARVEINPEDVVVLPT